MLISNMNHHYIIITGKKSNSIWDIQEKADVDVMLILTARKLSF